MRDYHSYPSPSTHSKQQHFKNLSLRGALTNYRTLKVLFHRMIYF